jgi:TorA maturation chaperone TorD
MTGRERALDHALARAVVSRFLKTGLRPPHREELENLFSPAAIAALRRAAVLLDGRELTVEVDLFNRSRTPSLEQAESDYNRLFGHTLRGRVCPYETEYGKAHAFQQAQMLSDLAGFYYAFGLRPANGISERVDHIAFELEFLEFLSRKEAFALERDDQDMLEVTRLAVKKLLREHLGRFGRAVGWRLRREDRDGFYGRLGSLCAVFLRIECERQAVPVGPEVLELRSTEEERVPMACGTAHDGQETGGTGFEV